MCVVVPPGQSRRGAGTSNLPSSGRTASRLHPGGIYTRIHEDGQCHYGLLFSFPADAAPGEARKRSHFNTQFGGRWGPLERWRLAPDPCGEDGVWRLLIPRTWLVLHGFLTLKSLLRPDRRYSLNRADELRAGFWLELPGGPPCQHER